MTAIALIEWFVQVLENFASRDMFFIFSPTVRSVTDHHVVVLNILRSGGVSLWALK